MSSSTIRASLWRVPVFLVLMLVARACPVLLLYREASCGCPSSSRWPSSRPPGCPLIVVITSIALAEGRMLPVNAASLVAAGMLSVLVFPAVGLWRMRVAGVAGTEWRPTRRGAYGDRAGASAEPSRRQGGVGRWTENQSRASR